MIEIISKMLCLSADELHEFSDQVLAQKFHSEDFKTAVIRIANALEAEKRDEGITGPMKRSILSSVSGCENIRHLRLIKSFTDAMTKQD